LNVVVFTGKCNFFSDSEYNVKPSNLAICCNFFGKCFIVSGFIRPIMLPNFPSSWVFGESSAVAGNIFLSFWCVSKNWFSTPFILEVYGVVNYIEKIIG
jgi:hypothetical protein